MEKIIKKVEMVTPTQPKAIRVAAYARVSSGKDSMLHSLAAQISYYGELIQSHPGWVYCGVYSDEAITGTKAERAGFQDMLSACRAGNVDLIITKSISRFARNTVTLLETVRELKALGVDVFFEEQNIHTMSGDGELMLSILAGYAEEESRSVSENMKWRVRRNFEEGIPWNCTLLGYRISGDHFEIVPEEAETVRFIFSEFLKGRSKRSIAISLNRQGVPTRKGNPWGNTAIDKLLQNPTYTGNLLLQTYYSENFLTKVMVKNNGELPMYQVADTHEAIIDLETFTKVQELLQTKKEANPQYRQEHKTYPFTGLITCARCGKSYRRKTTATGHIWICGTFNTLGKAACPSKAIPERVLYEKTADIDFQTLSGITAKDGNIIILHFHDGTERTCSWQNRSRSDSWTPEMRECARQRKIIQNWRKKNG